MSNAAGLVIMAIGALFLVVGIRGTQSTVLPQLFPKQSSASSSTAGAFAKGLGL